MAVGGLPDGATVPLDVVLHTALEAGVRVQMSGGYTSRVNEIMEVIATSLGAERAEASVSSVVVGLTVHRSGASATAFQRTPHMGINFSELSALSQLTAAAPSLPPAEISAQLSAIKETGSRYPIALVLPMLGLACASFAALFRADAVGIVVAGLGGFAGAFVRYRMAKAHYKPFIFCLMAAFTSTAVVLVGIRWSTTPTQALSACVLYLVPGVPLLNGISDLLSTHYLNGLVRLTMAMIIVLGSTIGIGIAIGVLSWVS